MIRKSRLKKRSEFLAVARQGAKVVTSGLIAQVLPLPGQKELRIGFTVTKKVGNAVIRNRAKRRLREASRLVVKENPPLLGDIVLIGRNQTLQRPFEQLKNDVTKAVTIMKKARDKIK